MLIHNGTTPGGFSSVFCHYPDDRLTVVVLCNIDRGDAVNVIATHRHDRAGTARRAGALTETCATPQSCFG